MASDKEKDKLLQQQGVTAMSDAERSENIKEIAGKSANKPDVNTGAGVNAYGDRAGSYSELARRTVEARRVGNKDAEEAEAKRLKRKRTLGVISNVIGGIGNMIAANAGAVPVKQNSTILDETKQEYANILDAKRKRAQEDMDLLYSARAADLKQAKAERAAERAAEREIAKMEREYINRAKLEDYKAENQAKLIKMRAKYDFLKAQYEQTGKMEHLNAMNKAKADLEAIKQDAQTKRAEATQRAIDDRTDASNKSQYNNAVSVEDIRKRRGISNEERVKSDEAADLISIEEDKEDDFDLD